MTVHQSVGAPYNVQGFPTIKVFGKNKNQPVDHRGILFFFLLNLHLS